MFICPNCQGRLSRAAAAGSVFWACPTCGGRAVSVSLLRQKADKKLVDGLWTAAREKRGEQKRPCPLCGLLMVTVTAYVGNPLALDVCTRCQFVWFDPKEFKALPTSPGSGTEAKLSPQARQAVTQLEGQLLKEKAASAGKHDHKPYTLIPDADSLPERWKLVPLLLGMPVEQESSVLQRQPWVTWSLTAIISLSSLVAFANLDVVVNNLGLIPVQAWRYGALTFLTSFFLHGGFFHLLANMYFLMVFGDNVEDFLGRGRYFLLLLLATVIGDFLHVAFDPHSNIPVIGASGGISGLVAFYGLQFPQARLVIWIRLFWLRIRAVVAMLLWIILQVIGAWQQMAGFSHVSALAHLGGAGTGFIFWIFWRKG